MLSTTLNVVPGESTFKLNMFTLMCGIFRFSTFSFQRILVPENERMSTDVRARGEKFPFSCHEEKYPLVLKAHNFPYKSRYIDNRHVRLLLSAFYFISCASQQCCWWWWRWWWWYSMCGGNTNAMQIFLDERAIE